MADLSVTAANVIASGSAVKSFGIAGEAITAGQAIYKNTADNNKLYKADCTTAAKAVCCGIALNGGSAGQQIDYVIEDPDFTPGATLSLSVAAVDGVYILSTAGGICPSVDAAASDYPVVLFVAKSASKAVMKIAAGTAALTA